VIVCPSEKEQGRGEKRTKDEQIGTGNEGLRVGVRLRLCWQTGDDGLDKVRAESVDRGREGKKGDGEPG
jgi:hypothetical protein